jgi:hypothetical protein
LTHICDFVMLSGHGRKENSCGHSLPPCSAFSATCRLLSCCPAHFEEQLSDHGCQAPTLQSVHFLHCLCLAIDCASALQPLPARTPAPFALCRMERIQRCFPAHDLVPCGDSQSEHAHSLIMHGTTAYTSSK